jgi:hypothetical protein
VLLRRGPLVAIQVPAVMASSNKSQNCDRSGPQVLPLAEVALEPKTLRNLAG